MNRLKFDLALHYPMRSDLNESDPIKVPEMYNYVCVHGLQCAIRKSRKKYEVVANGWCPPMAECQDLLPFGHWRLVYKDSTYADALKHFREVVRVLCQTIDKTVLSESVSSKLLIQQSIGELF